MSSGAARSHRAGFSSAPVFYEWKAESQDLSVQLAYAVIGRIQTEVMNGFWALPKRGAEIGGLLLGRVDSGPAPVVFIEDYEPVACEHRRGPSYALSEADRKRLERALRRSRGLQPVGYFRSHTRPGLYLDEDDMAVLRAYFAAPTDVFLLIRPEPAKPAKAGFFVWEEGDLRRHSPYREFVFDSAELMQPGPAPQPAAPAVSRLTTAPEPASPRAAAPPPTPAQPATVAPAVAAVPPPGPAPERARALRPPAQRWQPASAAAARRVRAGLSAVRASLAAAPRPWLAAGCLALILGAMEYQILATRRPQAHAEGPAALHVQQEGGNLRLTWNRSAPAVRKAGRAVLHIADGTQRREFHLDPTDLRTGSLVYAAAGPDVLFRLELASGSESLRVIRGGAAGPSPAIAAASAIPAQPPPAPAAAAPQAGTAARQAAEPPQAQPPRKPRRSRPVWWDDGL